MAKKITKKVLKINVTAKNKTGNAITVKNALGEHDTQAKVVICNKLDYTPKVSVIIPIYNVSDYLSECLDSVLNQTLKEIEVICIDDGSTDNSLEILKKYAKKDNRITILKQDNLHAGIARNAGLAIATGKYLSFLDADDFFDLNMLENLFDIAEKDSSDVVICSNYIYDQAQKKDVSHVIYGEKYLKSSPFTPSDFVDELCQICLPQAWTKLFRTSNIRKNRVFFEKFVSCNDITFVYTALAVANKISITPKPYVHYRINTKINISSNRGEKADCFVFAADKLIKNLRYYKLYNKFQYSVDQRIKDCFKWEMKQCDERQAERLVDTAESLFDKELFSFLCDSLPKVSVIIPVYNVSAYLQECLESIINQTLKDIEIVCVNDGSTDNSLNILKEYAKKDKRIKIIDQKNGGIGNARNNGIRYAKAPYVLFVDSDDWLDLTCLEKLYDKISSTDSDICIYGLQEYDESQNKFVEDVYYDTSCYKIRKHDTCDFKEIRSAIFRRFGAFVKMYKRDFFIQKNLFFPEKVLFEDVLTHVKAITLAKKISFCDENLYFYRMNRKGSIMNVAKANPKVFDIFLALESVGRFLIKEHLDVYLRKEYKDFVNEQIAFHIRRTGDEALRKRFEKAAQEFKNNLSLLSTLKVSVIIPVYNTEKYLAQCLDSVLNQTLQDIEVICVNDGSTDGSLEILNQYAAKDKRIKIIDQKNAGQGAARNSALKIARGEYICFLDSDDWLDKNTCKELYEYAKKLNLDMINFEGINYDVVKDNFYEVPGLKINYVSNYNKVYSKEEVLSFIDKVTVSACLMFYNADFIRNNDIKFPEGLFFEDNYFMLKALNLVNNYGVLAKKFYFRRKHPEQTTANWNKLFKDYIEIVTKIDELYNELHLENTDMYKVMMNKYCLSAISIYQSFDPADRNRYTRDLYQCIKAISNKVSLDKQILTFLDKVKNNTFYKEQLSNWYRRVRGVFLNLDNPKTYNEKMQWLKLYDSTPIKTQLADKLLVRDWIKDRIGEEYLIPLYGVYDRFEDIDFSKLPEKFVIKCNHGCGYNIIVTDKSALDLDEVKNKLDKWLAENFAFQAGFELHYRDIKPKIIIEKYIDPNISNHEIQVWTFNGKIEFISVETIKDIEDGERGVFYEDGSRAKFEITPQHYKRLDGGFSKKAFNKAIELSKKLLTDIPYVRIDFIEYEDTVIFREMTFTSGSGLSTIKPDRYNMVLGNMLKLPSLVYNIDTGEYYKLPRKSKTASYLLFPYYLVALGRKKKQYKRLMSRIISKHLKTMRIDVKNYGDVDNNVDVNASGTRVIQPLWYANEKGHGSVIESSNEEQQIKITAIGNGILRFAFRAPDKRYKDKRFPLYIDYTSIKIDGRELLSKPVITWHDLPFRYEMPVKNGQVINIIINQRHHKYLKEDLKDIICKVMPLSTYVQKNANKLLKLLRSFITKKSKVHIEDKFTKIIKICGIKFRVHDKHAEILDALNNMRLDINGVIKAQNIKLDRTEHAINNSVKQIEERLDKQTRIVSAEVMGAQDKLNNSLMTIAQELYNGITAVLKDNVMDLNDNLIHMLKIHMYTINRQMDEIKEYYGELQQFTSDTLSIQHKQLKEEAKKLEESINLVSSLIADIKENINKNKQQLLSNIKSDIKSVTNLTQSLLKNNEESALNIMDVVNNMRDDIRSQNVNIKSVADQTEEIVQDLKNSIDAEFKAMPVEIEKKQQYIARLHYEPYWANVYHDTILNSTWLKDKAVSPGRWAVSYIVLYVLYRTLNEMKPMNILECGLGQSSKLTVQYANAHNANLTIFENNPDWIKFFENNFLGADKYIKLLDLEMVELVPPYKSRTYAGFKDSIKDKKFDMVLIDGPLGCERYSRPEILDIVDNLAPSFIIMLDDMNRIGEQDIWKLLKEKLTKKGIAFVERLYASDKVLGVICSPDLQFLTSL